MGKIRVLSTVLINQIAAGEVIARPASVVKELVENAVDAGATRVRIEIGRDGRDIAVIDDGEGMSPEDAQMAVLRHATSKIADFDDLTHVTTRGFRGEALASVAAVSRLELLTRPHDQVAGYRLRVEGGEVVSSGPVGCAPGTTIRVRDLFFNTPARRKFLKSEASEYNAIMRLLTRQMLARGEVGFAVMRGERKVIELIADQPLAARMVHLLGNLAESQLLKVNTDKHGVRIYGYVTRPEASRKDRREQHFFVNQRPVTHRSMGYSLGQAYHGLLMAGRFPVCCLFVDVAPEEIDVNVHPTKEEIRFKDEGKATGVLNRAVVEALRGADLTPSMDLSGAETAAKDRAAPFAAQAERLGISAEPTPYGRGASATRRSEGAFVELPLPERPRLKEIGKAPERAGPVGYGASSIDEAGGAVSDPKGPSHEDTSKTSQDTVAQGAEAPLSSAPLARERLAVLGQVGDAYVVAAMGDDLLVVDQHAAHERINYNRVLAALGAGESDSQPLLLPITFEIGAADEGRVEALLPELARVGITVESFGGRAYVVTAVPAALPDLDAASLIHDLLSEPEEAGGLRDASPHERLAARIACHASVKAEQRLSVDEAQHLLENLLAEDAPHTCPHGRPTMMRLTREELDKRFKRT